MRPSAPLPRQSYAELLAENAAMAMPAMRSPFSAAAPQSSPLGPVDEGRPASAGRAAPGAAGLLPQGWAQGLAQGAPQDGLPPAHSRAGIGQQRRRAQGAGIMSQGSAPEALAAQAQLAYPSFDAARRTTMSTPGPLPSYALGAPAVADGSGGAPHVSWAPESPDAKLNHMAFPQGPTQPQLPATPPLVPHMASQASGLTSLGSGAAAMLQQQLSGLGSGDESVDMLWLERAGSAYAAYEGTALA